MTLTSANNGELMIRAGGREIRYSRVHANQLILCARMNDWNRFTAMWEKKTPAETWKVLQESFEAMDMNVRWKLKETFARLTTVDEEPPTVS